MNGEIKSSGKFGQKFLMLVFIDTYFWQLFLLFVRYPFVLCYRDCFFFLLCIKIRLKKRRRKKGEDWTRKKDKICEGKQEKY